MACTVPAVQEGFDIALAMEMWWRAAALEALHAYVLGPLAGAPRQDQPKLLKTIATLLQPTLDAIANQPLLQVGTFSAPSLCPLHTQQCIEYIHLSVIRGPRLIQKASHVACRTL